MPLMTSNFSEECLSDDKREQEDELSMPKRKISKIVRKGHTTATKAKNVTLKIVKPTHFLYPKVRYLEEEKETIKRAYRV
ncbi:MAG: hypothetical protein NZ805_13990 [Armatimonadetes bacterium]|nr:hypothetical protein [Armatimonadota bacterium]